MAMNTNWKLAAMLGTLLASCGSVQDVQAGSDTEAPKNARAATDDADDEEDGDDENEVEVALDQVPAALKAAALAAVPGLVLTGAEKETEEGTLVYCLEGMDGDEAVEVEVRADDAKVVEIERGEDD